MPTTATNPSLLDLVADPEAYRVRLAELVAEVESATKAKHAAEQAVAELTAFIEVVDEFGKPLREIADDIRKREAAIAKQESRIASTERRLRKMKEIIR